MNVLDSIRNTVKSAGTDLANFYLQQGLTDLETQILTSEGAQPRIQDGYRDRELRGSLQRIGTTGRDWVTGRCIFLAFDIDHVDDHPNVGWSSEAIQSAIAKSPDYVSWFWSRRAKGVTGVVLMTCSPAPDRQSQINLGKRLKLRLQADDFPVEMIDCIGQNCWIWCSSATGQAHSLIQRAGLNLSDDDLPPLPSEPKVEYAKADLTDRHKQDLAVLAATACPPQYVSDQGCFRVHTIFLNLIDPNYRTDSPGTDPSHPNAYVFPLGDGAWSVHRYGSDESAVLNPHHEFDFSEFKNDPRPEPPPDKPGPRIEFVDTVDLIAAHPKRRPPIIDGLLRKGEVWGIAAASKVGKSWNAYGIALAVASGGMCFGKFQCRPGRVLLIDNELDQTTIAYRIATVAAAMGLQPKRDWITTISLRGQDMDLYGIRDHILPKIERGQFDLVMLDAWYRSLPKDIDENSNSGITRAFNIVTQFAEKTNAAWNVIQHFFKGDQSGKEVTDLGVGAGAQSRAADNWTVLRHHEEENHLVLEARVRDFEPIDPVVLRWDFPLFHLTDLDPNALRDPKSKRKQRDESTLSTKILDALRQQPMSMNALETATGAGHARIGKLLGPLMVSGMVQFRIEKRRGQSTKVYEVTT